MCVLTNEGYKTYQTDFLSVTWIMPKGWDLVVVRGAKNKIPSLTIMLSPAKPIPNLVCVLLTFMGCATAKEI